MDEMSTRECFWRLIVIMIFLALGEGISRALLLNAIKREFTTATDSYDADISYWGTRFEKFEQQWLQSLPETEVEPLSAAYWHWAETVVKGERE